jgi:ribonuclease Z
MLARLKRAAARRVEARFAEAIRARFAAPLAKSDLFDDNALRLILCGTSSPLPDPDRAKSCVLVIAGGKAYAVDTGPESWKTLGLLNFPGARIAAILLTHFHSDHIGDLGEFRMQTWVGGRRRPLPVYGPPGVDQVVAGFNQAYAFDDQYRTTHHGADIMPLEGANLAAKPFAIPEGAQGKCFTVLEADGLTVSAFEVDHSPAAPAVGYRFDYRGRSVVISGDTKKLASVAVAAQGADVLIHDALSQPLRQVLADEARRAGNPRVAKLFDDIGDYHADPIEAADVANDAGVRLLIYTHFVPSLAQSALRLAYFNGVDAIRPRTGWTIGYDGLRIDCPVNGTEVVQSRMALRSAR